MGTMLLLMLSVCLGLSSHFYLNALAGLMRSYWQLRAMNMQ